MDKAALDTSIRASASLEFSRSGGPGGQNINKVNSKATARVAFAAILGLSQRERTYALLRLAGRLTTGGELLASADDERDQVRNRELAIQRLILLVERAATIPKTRIPTVATRASRERRMTSKHLHSGIKRGRSEQGFEA